METMEDMKRYPRIVIFTTLLCLSLLLSVSVFKTAKPQPELKVSLQDQPSIGNGKIQMVVFEDFNCAHCKDFTLRTLPHLNKQFIQTNIASLTLIPVCFHEGSKPATNAALSVYQIAKERFLDFVTAIVEKKPYFKKDILQVAQLVGGIDLEVLSELIDKKTFYEKIEQNLNLAIHEIGPDFGTPSFFINGVFVPLDSVETQLQAWNGL